MAETTKLQLFPRLRDLLQREEKQYITELASKKETVLERQARMRERAKQLRDKREAERVALVENKLEQRWRYTTTCMKISSKNVDSSNECKKIIMFHILHDFQTSV